MAVWLAVSVGCAEPADKTGDDPTTTDSDLPAAQVDVDGDGFSPIEEGGEDCNDADGTIHPDAAEIYYDGVDNDCDASTLDDDQDGDGDPIDTDCDDTDPAVSSSEPEVYYDFLDNDCDPATADNDQDADGDPVGTDCDDLDPLVGGNQPEIYYDGIDNDCDGNTVDDDQDHDGDPVLTDCDDLDPNRASIFTEIFRDGIDNDCDPSTSDVLLIDPMAVGFELDAVMLADGTLSGYDDGLSWVEPTLTLRFASIDFFSSGDVEDTCEAIASFAVAPKVKPDQIPTFDAVAVHQSYETNISILSHDCDQKVDPALWGVDAVDLITPFEGAHFGIGMAPFTTYLEGQWSAQALIDYQDSFLATYIAVNDASGAWVGTDWTSAILFEWDPLTLGLVVDPATGLLVPIDISGVPVGGDLPEGYIRSFAYWYQDFPLMDFTNLADPPI